MTGCWTKSFFAFLWTETTDIVSQPIHLEPFYEEMDAPDIARYLQTVIELQRFVNGRNSDLMARRRIQKAKKLSFNTIFIKDHQPENDMYVSYRRIVY